MSRMKPDCKPPLAKSPIRLRPRRALGSNLNCKQTPASRSEIRFEHTDEMLAEGSSRKSEKGRRRTGTGTLEMEETEELRREYGSISWEMRALAKMVGDEFGKEDCVVTSAADSWLNSRSPLFERGRFYEEYSARRNERLNRKKKMIGSGSSGTNNSTTASTFKYNNYNSKLGVTVESGKRKSSTTSTTSTCSTTSASSTRKLQSLRRSVSAASSAVESQRTMTTSQCETPAPAPRYMLRSLLKNKENQKPPLPQPTLYFHHTSAVRGGRKVGAPRPRVGYY